MVEFSLGFLNGSVQHNSFFSNADQAFAVIFKAKAPWWAYFPTQDREGRHVARGEGSTGQ
jgi:hypothetical protein